uniref:Uncharacterized protein n=1 Tax=Ralstonia solanacearum TaxID=305 RepID=A0A0S4V9Z2_RALSL|nr:protein of unknown function [Ralstonia solanacearum]
MNVQYAGYVDPSMLGSDAVPTFCMRATDLSLSLGRGCVRATPEPATAVGSPRHWRAVDAALYQPLFV